MKSDTDFANPYEKELDAQESKIKELEKKLHEANMRSAPELEKKLEAMEMVHSNYVNVSCDLYSTLEKKLEIAVEALRYMADLDDNNDGVKYREASEQALKAIEEE